MMKLPRKGHKQNGQLFGSTERKRDVEETDTNVTKTSLYNFDPLKPHFYRVKLGFTGVYIIFLIFAKKHILWVLDETVLTSTHNLCLEEKYEKYKSFLSENFRFFGGEIFYRI